MYIYTFIVYENKEKKVFSGISKCSIVYYNYKLDALMLNRDITDGTTSTVTVQ